MPKKTVFDLQEERNRKQREVLEACFTFATDSATQIIQQSPIDKEQASTLDDNALRAWLGGQMFDGAHEHRRELQQMYVDVEAWFQTEVEARVEEVEKQLWPSVASADPATILAVSQASEETLKAMLETAKSTGNVPTFELILKTAHDRDFDGIVDIAVRDNEELEGLYSELIEADRVPLYENPEERFEMLAQEVPDKERLLSDASDKLRLAYGLPSR
jgi:hypothetical protein